MELSNKYQPSSIESKWYKYWYDHKFFNAKPNANKVPYSIVIPPPNVTGVLHMGHVLNNTIQDILVRHARMQGKEACWVPGTDHASIATETKVVERLRQQGKTKSELGREGFLKEAWKWTDEYGGIILEQLKKLGCCCDWDRTKFTLDKDLSNSVIKTFVDLYNKGLIYRGLRMVNWDPVGQTALSDEEVIHREKDAILYHVKYKLAQTHGYVTIATTRPETIMADTAICVHPDDQRYVNLHNQKVHVPLTNRTVTIITDEYVDKAFGTGCLKVTPAHDTNDYELGLKHNLEVIDILNPNATLNAKAGADFDALDRFEARKKAVKMLEAEGLLVKTETYKGSVGHSERTDAVIEPRLSLQWFLKMETLAKPALEAVKSSEVKLTPEKFNSTYYHWMENVRDWCISRQLWWGHRIPAYYLPDKQVVVAHTKEEALKMAQTIMPGITTEQLTQDEDVLDTWFSSWLWPMSVFDGINNPDNPDFKYFYPTNDLVSAPEILFFWIARMIIAGFEYTGKKPFNNVYLTGIVRDSQRRKMSKSLGNSPNPLDLIKQYGADAVRAGMLFSSPAGNDLLYDEKLIEQGRNFNNKIWNAFRLIKNWETTTQHPDQVSIMAADWFANLLHKNIAEIEHNLKLYRISDALMCIYKLIRDDFCSWYLEMIKPQAGQPIHESVYKTAVFFFEQLMTLLHPFMPFITEEVWQQLKPRTDGQAITVATYPTSQAYNQEILRQFETTFAVVSAIRNLRAANNISPKNAFEVFVKSTNTEIIKFGAPVISKLANVDAIHYDQPIPEPALSFVIKEHEFYIPAEGTVDLDKQIADIEKELEYAQGFLKSVEKKLSNERFVNNAPEQVVANEKAKKADAQSKIEALEKTLSQIKK